MVLLAVTAVLAAPLMAQVLDRVVRYVNGDMITQREVFESVRAEITSRRRAGQPTPRAQPSCLKPMLRNLRMLTNERLMLQEAVRLGVVIDDRLIRRQTWRGQSKPAWRAQLTSAWPRQSVGSMCSACARSCSSTSHTPGITPNTCARSMPSASRNTRDLIDAVFCGLRCVLMMAAGSAAIRRDLMACSAMQASRPIRMSQQWLMTLLASGSWQRRQDPSAMPSWSRSQQALPSRW